MSATAWIVLVLEKVWSAVWPRWLIAAIAFALIHVVFRGFFRRHKIQDKSFDWKQLRFEVIFSLLTLGLGNFIGVAVELIVDGGYGRILRTSLDWKTVRTIAWQFAVYFVLFDIYFYWLHRLMHTKALFWMHRVHHRSRAPNPLSAFSFHPLEGLITGGFVPLMVLLFDLHITSIIVVNLYGVLNSVLVHSGHEIFPRWWYRKGRLSRFYLSPMFHDRHHTAFRTNYGAFTTIWDRLFGTIHPAFEADYEKLQQKIASLRPVRVEASPAR